MSAAAAADDTPKRTHVRDLRSLSAKEWALVKNSESARAWANATVISNQQRAVQRDMAALGAPEVDAADTTECTYCHQPLSLWLELLPTVGARNAPKSHAMCKFYASEKALSSPQVRGVVLVVT